MSGHDPANTSYNSGEHILGPRTVGRLHAVWSYRHPVSSLIVVGSRAYAAVPAGIRVLDAHNGRTVRLFTTRHLGLTPGLMATALAYSHGVLVFVSSRMIVAFSPSSGAVFWKRPVSFTTNLMIDGDVVYTGSYCFNGCPTYALDLHSGTQLWENPIGGLVQSEVGGRLYEGLLWQGHCQDRILDARTGSLIATLSSCGTWTGNSQHTYGLVFPPDLTQPAAIEPVAPNGTPGSWSVQVGRPESTEIVFAGGILVAPTARPHDGITAVRVRDGKVLWRRAFPGRFQMLAANGLLFVLHHNGWIDALRTATGRTVRRLRLPRGKGDSLFGGLVAGGQLYASIGKSTVVMRP
jgi:hypothetical protein